MPISFTYDQPARRRERERERERADAETPERIQAAEAALEFDPDEQEGEKKNE